MKNKTFIVAILGILISGCEKSATKNVTNVADVIANIHKWNGKTVVIEGWLGECGGYDCGLYQSLEDARTVANGDYKTTSWSEAMGRRLGIGYDETFDGNAYFLQFKPVILQARVSDECRRESTCFDRAPDLSPISIRLNYTKKEH